MSPRRTHWQAKAIPFDEFLSTAFDLSPTWRGIHPVFRDISKSFLFQKLLRGYTVEATNEMRCHQFNKLANFIIQELMKYYIMPEEESIIFRCNDFDEGIPGGVIVYESAMRSKDQETTVKYPFHRSELLDFVVFQNKDGENLQAPSGSKRRRQAPVSRQDILFQCANYALRTLSECCLRSHVLGVLITGGYLELLYYSRSDSLVKTSVPLHVLRHPSSLVAFLYCILQPTSRPFSSMPPSPLPTIPAQISPSGLLHAACTNSNADGGVSVKFGNLVCVYHSLIGQKTSVAKINVTVIGGWISHHLRHHEALSLNDIDVGFEYPPSEEFKHERRMLRILVAPKLLPLTMLTTTETLMPVIRDVFNCCRQLYEEANIMHRNISLNSLMYQKNADESICGVLSDFDLSPPLNGRELGPSSRQFKRTEPTPYMAKDLLGPSSVQHLYRHDLESLLYVLVILTSGYHNGRAIENPPLRDWFTLAPAQLYHHKNTFILDQEVPPLTPNFVNTRAVLTNITVQFRLGYCARSSHFSRPNSMRETGDGHEFEELEFDELTLGGHVDFKAFENILFGYPPM